MSKNQQIIERLAEFMGWRNSKLPIAYEMGDNIAKDNVEWNPLKDWNHTMQIVDEHVKRGGTFELSYQEGRVAKIRVNDEYYEMIDGDVKKTVCEALLSTLK